MKPKVHRLGDLQLRIMKLLWSQPEMTVGDLATEFGTEFAYTTLATMVRKMEERGLVSHREQDRKFFYKAEVQAEQVGKGMSDHLIERIFDGSITSVVSHLLTTREISKAELVELEKMIAAHKKGKKS